MRLGMAFTLAPLDMALMRLGPEQTSAAAGIKHAVSQVVSPEGAEGQAS